MKKLFATVVARPLLGKNIVPAWPVTAVLFTIIISLFPFPSRSADSKIRLLTGNVSTYDAATDNTGRIHVIWRKSDGLHYGVLENESLVSQELVPGSNPMNIRYTRPRLAVKPDGTEVHTAWTPKVGQSEYIVHAWRNASGWHTEKAWRKKDDNEFAAVPAIGVDMTGTVHMVAQFFGDNPEWSSLRYLFKPKSGAWSNPVEIQDPEGRQWRDTSMFTDPEGGVHATWKSGRLKPGRYCYAPSGGSLLKQNAIDIPRAPGTNAVSLGDSYVRNGNVHHAFLVMKTAAEIKGIDYQVKKKGAKSFGNYSHASTGWLDLCGYEWDLWPSIAVAANGKVFVSWADAGASCTQKKATRVVLAVLEDGVWKHRVLDDQADVLLESKPVLVADKKFVTAFWRNRAGALVMQKLDPDISAEYEEEALSEAGPESEPEPDAYVEKETATEFIPEPEPTLDAFKEPETEPEAIGETLAEDSMDQNLAREEEDYKDSTKEYKETEYSGKCSLDSDCPPNTVCIDGRCTSHVRNPKNCGCGSTGGNPVSSIFLLTAILAIRGLKKSSGRQT
ncbi:MAG: hypothetical protein GXP49_14560 [Deltaproteobacteria bacterium]|nr:hypothetical protein [Deltaproteobacteria bacterium]